MRTFALLAAIAVADKSDFPADDDQHADCHVTGYFDAQGCDALYSTMSYVIGLYEDPEKSPAGGEYHYFDGAAYDWFWTTRLTKDKQYTDDQIFEFT